MNYIDFGRAWKSTQSQAGNYRLKYETEYDYYVKGIIGTFGGITDCMWDLKYFGIHVYPIDHDLYLMGNHQTIKIICEQNFIIENCTYYFKT